MQRIVMPLAGFCFLLASAASAEAPTAVPDRAGVIVYSQANSRYDCNRNGTSVWQRGYGRGDTSRTTPNGLPRGRTYYNGRYFGNFNNRYYGPQYGYF